MYILTYNQYDRHEGTATRVVAVSESVDALKSKASEDTNIFDEAWSTDGDYGYNLTVGESNNYYENFYYIKKVEVC